MARPKKQETLKESNGNPSPVETPKKVAPYKCERCGYVGNIDYRSGTGMCPVCSQPVRK